MALIEINKNPSERELRQFGGIWLPAFLLLAGFMVWRKTGSLAGAAVPCGVALGVCAVGLRFPGWMRKVYLAWMYAAFPIGWTVSHLLLAVIFFLVLTPIGLMMRLLGRDPLNRLFNPAVKTYWTHHNPGDNMARYFKQF